MQKEVTKRYSPMNIINFLQGIECLAEGRQDLEASGGCYINRQYVVNIVKLWCYQNPDKRSQ